MSSLVRPALRRAAILACVVLTPLVIHRVWDYVELRRLIGEIQAVLDRDEPVTDRETRLWSSPTGDDAAGYYLSSALLAFTRDAPARARPLVRAVHDSLSGASQLPATTGGVAADLREIAEGSQETFALADTASRLVFRGFPPGTEFNYRVAALIDLSVLLSARTQMLSLAGDGDAAVAAARSALSLRRVTDELQFPLRAEDSEVAAILSWSAPSVEALAGLEEALRADEQPDRGLQTLLRGRARFVDLLWGRYYGTDPSAPGRYSLPLRTLPELVYRPWLTHQLVTLLRVWAELVEAARAPWPTKGTLAEEMIRVHRPPTDAPQRYYVLNLSPEVAVFQFEQATRPDRLIVNRASRVAIAVERFKRERGELPGTLGDLLPQYLDQPLEDPMTGNPLLYRREEGAYVVYSVGTDGTDDGGRLFSEAPRGAARPFVQGPDIGVRVLTRP